jgi:hypothetical protein
VLELESIAMIFASQNNLPVPSVGMLDIIAMMWRKRRREYGVELSRSRKFSGVSQHVTLTPQRFGLSFFF